MKGEEELPGRQGERRAFQEEGTAMQRHGALTECSLWPLPITQDCWGRKFRKRWERSPVQQTGSDQEGPFRPNCEVCSEGDREPLKDGEQGSDVIRYGFWQIAL